MIEKIINKNAKSFSLGRAFIFVNLIVLLVQVFCKGFDLFHVAVEPRQLFLEFNQGYIVGHPSRCYHIWQFINFFFIFFLELFFELTIELLVEGQKGFVGKLFFQEFQIHWLVKFDISK